MPLLWRDVFNQIHPDLPKEELHQRILDFETAICERREQLHAEAKEITDALDTVHRLQVEKLGYPDSRPGKVAANPTSQT